jgi:phosphonate transport system permease protein
MSTIVNNTGQSPLWRPKPLIQSQALRWVIVLGCIAYLFFGMQTVTVDPERIARGIPRALAFVQGFLSPDFSTRSRDIVEGILESLAITVASTVMGVLLSVPIAFGAARNLVPMPVYYLCRGIIAASRTFQEVIIAIFFVALVGFGPFAGVLTLAFATIGFLAKLLAEEIESMEMDTIEAIRATGASWLKTATWAVFPRVQPRLFGLSLYRLDINFRESAVIGVVGAGGIGGTLATTFDRYEYNSAAAILMLIIGIVFLNEIVANYLRKKAL